jgi:hypothetical protein
VLGERIILHFGLKEIGPERVEWIKLAQNRGQMARSYEHGYIISDHTEGIKFLEFNVTLLL